MDHIEITYLDPIQLKAHPDNAKIHTDKQIDRIAKSMKNTGGSVQPILVDENHVILAGHGRWMAHKKMGDTACPVVVKAGLTDFQKKKFLLADNQTNAMTGNAFDAVAALLSELDEAEIDISDIGFSDKEIDKFLNFNAEEDERDEFEEASEESAGMTELKPALLLTAEDCVGTLQMPRLREDMIPYIPESEFVVWMNRHRTPPLGDNQMYYHLFGRESTKGLDPQTTLISFYIDDHRFERVWNKLKENTQRMLNAKAYATVMPDFSRSTGAPLPYNAYNAYRSFYCALYWQMAGLEVIPNLVAWDEDSVESCSLAIPQGAPVVSCQIQTMGREMRFSGNGMIGWEPEQYRNIFGAQLDIIKPETLMVYGGEPGLILGEEICKRHGVRFIGVSNRANAATNLDNERGF